MTESDGRHPKPGSLIRQRPAILTHYFNRRLSQLPRLQQVHASSGWRGKRATHRRMDYVITFNKGASSLHRIGPGLSVATVLAPRCGVITNVQSRTVRKSISWLRPLRPPCAKPLVFSRCVGLYPICGRSICRCPTIFHCSRCNARSSVLWSPIPKCVLRPPIPCASVISGPGIFSHYSGTNEWQLYVPCCLFQHT